MRKTYKKLLVLFVSLLCIFSFQSVAVFGENEGINADIMDVKNWICEPNAVIKESDGLVFNANAYTKVPSILNEDYLNIEFELRRLDSGDTWANINLTTKSMQVSPAGAVSCNGIYFLFYNFDGKLAVSLLHKGPLGDSYIGVYDELQGINPVDEKHNLEILFVDEELNIFIDGVQYRKGSLNGIYREDLISETNETFLSYSCYGEKSEFVLNSVSTVNNRDMKSPVIVSNVSSVGKVGEAVLLIYPTVTDNIDASLSVDIAVYDPTGLQIYPENNRFIPSIKGKYNVVYKTIDSSGNEATLIHPINVSDANNNSCSSSVGDVTPLTLIACAICILIRNKRKV